MGFCVRVATTSEDESSSTVLPPASAMRNLGCCGKAEPPKALLEAWSKTSITAGEPTYTVMPGMSVVAPPGKIVSPKPIAVNLK